MTSSRKNPDQEATDAMKWIARQFGSARSLSGALTIGIALMTNLSGCTTAPTPASRSVDALFAETTSTATPGAAIMVIRDGKVLQKSAYGMADIERGVPFETDTSTRLGSVSKQFTAMAIMLLEEEGKLDYDDPITRFLPEISRIADRITIRNLLNHTGGLPDYYDVMVEVTGVERPLTRPPAPRATRVRGPQALANQAAADSLS